MTEQTTEQQTAPTAAPVTYQDTPAAPAAADVAPQPPQESTAQGDGGAAPAVADSTSLEPATAGGSVGVGDLVGWTETDAEGYEHQRTGLVQEVLELPGVDEDGGPELHARVVELPEPRLLAADRLEQLH